MPYLVQTLHDMNEKIDQVTKKTSDIQKKEEKKALQEENQPPPMPLEFAEMLMPGFSPFPQLMAPPEMMAGMQGMYYPQLPQFSQTYQQ